MSNNVGTSYNSEMNFTQSSDNWDKWINDDSKLSSEIFIDEEQEKYDIELIENIFSKNFYKIEYENSYEKKSININDCAFILQKFKENNNNYFIVKPTSHIIYEDHCVDDNNISIINTKIQYDRNLAVNIIQYDS